MAAGGTAPASQVGIASTNTASGTNQPTSEIIKTGDVLVITFADLPPPPMPAFDQRVRDDGTITLIHNHVFQAAGKRVGDLEREIHDFYVPRYYINLTVTVRPPSDRFFYVDGEVRLPNKFPWVNGTTVTKAIASAGGFTDFASKTTVRLIRADGTKQTVNCNKVLDHPELDPLVFPNDRIHVKRRIL
jgi:polysaccharide export outer membrane protein